MSVYFMYPAMVIREFRATKTPKKGPLIVIAGRREGFWNLLMSLIGMGTEIRFEVTRTLIEQHIESPNVAIINSVPVTKVSSTICGFSNNVAYIVFGIMGLMGGVGAMLQSVFAGVMGLAVGALMLILYFMSKRLLLVVETVGGHGVGIRFKPGEVGRYTIDLEEARRVVDIIHFLGINAAAEAPELKPPVRGRDDEDLDDEDEDDVDEDDRVRR